VDWNFNSKYYLWDISLKKLNPKFVQLHRKLYREKKLSDEKIKKLRDAGVDLDYDYNAILAAKKEEERIYAINSKIARSKKIEEINKIEDVYDSVKLFSYWNDSNPFFDKKDKYRQFFDLINDYYTKNEIFSHEKVKKLCKKYKTKNFDYEDEYDFYYNGKVYFKDFLGVKIQLVEATLSNLEPVEDLIKKLNWIKLIQGDYCTYINYKGPTCLKLLTTYFAFLFEAKKCGVKLNPKQNHIVKSLSSLNLIVEMNCGYWVQGKGFLSSSEDGFRFVYNNIYDQNLCAKASFIEDEFMEELAQIKTVKNNPFDIKKYFKGEALSRVHSLICHVDYKSLSDFLDRNNIKF
jgi:hypothetical protein